MWKKRGWTFCIISRSCNFFLFFIRPKITGIAEECRHKSSFFATIRICLLLPTNPPPSTYLPTSPEICIIYLMRLNFLIHENRPLFLRSVELQSSFPVFVGRKWGKTWYFIKLRRRRFLLDFSSIHPKSRWKIHPHFWIPFSTPAFPVQTLSLPSFVKPAKNPCPNSSSTHIPCIKTPLAAAAAAAERKGFHLFLPFTTRFFFYDFEFGKRVYVRPSVREIRTIIQT